MNRMVVLIFIMMGILFSITAICENEGIFGPGSEPSSSTSTSSSSIQMSTTFSYGSQYSGGVKTYSPGATPENEPESMPTQYATQNYPIIETLFEIEPPAIIPDPSTEGAVPYLYHGMLPMEDLYRLGGAIFPGYGIQYYTLYNNLWNLNPSAYWFNQQTNTVIYIDQPQYIRSYAKYPDGRITWQDWGYYGKGYSAAWFLADAIGWHQLAIWGSQSGLSNVLWIYVW